MGNEPMKLTFGANALDLVNSPDPKRCFGHDKWSVDLVEINLYLLSI